jgi:hypothetical protein
VRIGDICKIGDAAPHRPETPCYKLAARHALMDLPVRMITSGVRGAEPEAAAD